MYLVIVFNNKGHIKKVFIKYKGHKVCIVGKVCKKKKENDRAKYMGNQSA